MPYNPRPPSSESETDSDIDAEEAVEGGVETPDQATLNAASFLDILTTTLLQLTNPPKSKAQRKAERHAGRQKSHTQNNARNKAGDQDETQDWNPSAGTDRSTSNTIPPSDLTDSLSFAASEIFNALPAPLRTSSSPDFLERKDAERYTPPLSPDVEQALQAPIPIEARDELAVCLIALLPDAPQQGDTKPAQDILLLHILSDSISTYLSTLTTPIPPLESSTSSGNTRVPRPDACELCARSWIPLTAHHLIPRSTHAKVVKRGWHSADDLQKLAWICRACHNFVHGMATNEELAREWYDLDKIRDREDTQRWVGWVSRVRWKAR